MHMEKKIVSISSFENFSTPTNQTLKDKVVSIAQNTKQSPNTIEEATTAILEDVLSSEYIGEKQLHRNYLIVPNMIKQLSEQLNKYGISLNYSTADTNSSANFERYFCTLSWTEISGVFSDDSYFNKAASSIWIRTNKEFDLNHIWAKIYLANATNSGSLTIPILTSYPPYILKLCKDYFPQFGISVTENEDSSCINFAWNFIHSNYYANYDDTVSQLRQESEKNVQKLVEAIWTRVISNYLYSNTEEPIVYTLPYSSYKYTAEMIKAVSDYFLKYFIILKPSTKFYTTKIAVSVKRTLNFIDIPDPTAKRIYSSFITRRRVLWKYVLGLIDKTVSLEDFFIMEGHIYELYDSLKLYNQYFKKYGIKFKVASDELLITRKNSKPLTKVSIDINEIFPELENCLEYEEFYKELENALLNQCNINGTVTYAVSRKNCHLLLNDLITEKLIFEFKIEGIEISFNGTFVTFKWDVEEK